MGSGGKRDGSGRKAVDQAEKRVQVSISVAPETKVRMEQIRQHGDKVGKVVDILIEQYCAELK